MTGGPKSQLQNLSGLLARAFGKGTRVMENPPRPDIPVAVIGDIHGRADLLENLLNKLSTVAPGVQLVFVGDFVDRGPASKDVLDLVQNPTLGAICISGNHEVMLREFLQDPIANGGRWLRNGGFATLQSYGVELDASPTALQLADTVVRFEKALGSATIGWLESLPLFWQSGNLLVTHAGPDPARRISEQSERDFTWGHNRFLRDERSDGVWIAHGHWIRDRPTCVSGRINVDTGAWKSGRLTAALLDPDGSVRFVAAK